MTTPAKEGRRVVRVLDGDAALFAGLAEEAEACAKARVPILHCMMGTLEHKDDWFARMERSGVPTFKDAEEMCIAAGALARHRELNALR